MKRKFILVCLAVLIMLALPMTAAAQSFDAGRVGSVSLSLKAQDGVTPMAGAELELYYVATVEQNSSGKLSYTFTDAFKGCGAAMDDPSLAVILDAYVQPHMAVAATKTDANGSALFAGLPLGLYFVKQTGAVPGYAPCTPFLVTVPNTNAGGYVYDIDASPKTEVAKLTSVTVKKVWNTDESTPIAESVTVQLLKNGAVVETATLNAHNNWQVTYYGMPESDAYSILEVNIPEGFTATYSNSGYVFTVTNSASLIQTGQLVWPIPVLALAGIVLIALGALMLNKSRKNAQ